jgi:ribosomal protein S18 acetylase RimI-like enzyme
MGDPGGQRSADLAHVTLREAAAADEPFLFELYGSTREEERRMAQWEPAAWHAFLRHQFSAQRDHSRHSYPAAVDQIIHEQHTPIGRLYVDRSGDTVHVLDITLLPQHRRRGIGTALIGGLLREAGDAGRPVTLYVSAMNPGARRFYDRLGFAPAREHGLYTMLTWHSVATVSGEEGRGQARQAEA